MKKILTTAIVLGMIAAGCKKEVIEEPVPPVTPGNTSNGSLAAFFAQSSPQEQTFTINAASQQLITGSQGTQVLFSANSFVDQNGQPVNGTITIKLKEVFNKKDMILSGASTISGGKPLISDGEIYLAATQNNYELHLTSANSVTVAIPTTTTAPISNMNEFYAREINDTADFTPADTTQFIPVINYQSVYFYSFAIDHLNWINCDYYMFQGGPETVVEATVPAQFNDQNCRLFIAFNGQKSAAECYHYDTGLHEFSPGSSYQLPIGMGVTFVAIAEINGQFYSAFQSATIGNNHNETMNLVQSTQAQINQQLINLQ